MNVNTRDMPFVSVGSHVSNSSLSSAVPISVPAGATAMYVQAITQNVRVTLDGTTTPTASVGFQIKAGDPPTAIPVISTTVISFIQETGGAGIQYQFVKQVANFSEGYS